MISSSMVSMRFLVSGPVSSIVCLPRPLPSVVDAVAVHAARAELLLERRVLGIVGQLRLFLGVQVIEVAEELVEAVHGRQVFVAVAEVVLAELAGGVAERLEQLGDRRVFLLQADRRAGHADLGQARADRILAGDEARAAGGAALLRVVVGERHAFLGDAVDVRGPVAHHAAAEVADVPDADVVAPEDQDVRFLCCHYVFLPLRRMIKSRANNEARARQKRYSVTTTIVCFSCNNDDQEFDQLEGSHLVWPSPVRTRFLHLNRSHDDTFAAKYPIHAHRINQDHGQHDYTAEEEKSQRRIRRSGVSDGHR